MFWRDCIRGQSNQSAWRNFGDQPGRTRFCYRDDLAHDPSLVDIMNEQLGFFRLPMTVEFPRIALLGQKQARMTALSYPRAVFVCAPWPVWRSATLGLRLNLSDIAQTTVQPAAHD